MFQLYMLACNMLMTHNPYLYLCCVAAHDCVPRFSQASACVWSNIAAWTFPHSDMCLCCKHAYESLLKLLLDQYNIQLLTKSCFCCNSAAATQKQLANR